MGYFKIRGALALGGGSVQLGADTNIYRKAANQLATDDGLHLAGTVGVVGAAVHTGAVTLTGGVATGSGTPFHLPYGTAVPTLDANGDVRIWHKTATTHRAALVFYSNGTAYQLQFPATSDGTVTVTIGAPA